MKLKKIMVLTLISSILFSGCSVNASDDIDTPYKNCWVPVEELPKYENATDKLSISDKLCDNSIRIFKETYNQQSNNLVSPLSLQCALALLLDSTTGSAHQELLDFYGLTDGEIEKLTNRLVGVQEILENDNQTVIKDNQTVQPIEVPKYNEIYKIINAVWLNTVSESYKVNPEYQSKVKDKYNAEIRGSNLCTEEGLKELNDWVKENTLGLIDSIIPQPVTPDMCLALLNTIGFECSWTVPFERVIDNQDFTKGNGEKIKTSLMIREDTPYINTENVQGVKLDFIPVDENNKVKFSLIAVMSNKLSIDDYVNSLTIEELKEITKETKDLVKVSIPSFKFSDDINAKPILQSLGLDKIFYPNKEISLMANGIPHQIDEVIQKTKIEVTQYGTKAAAVTVLLTKNTALPIEKHQKEIVFNKPFFYMIWDNTNQVPIFIGTVDNPK